VDLSPTLGQEILEHPIRPTYFGFWAISCGRDIPLSHLYMHSRDGGVFESAYSKNYQL